MARSYEVGDEVEATEEIDGGLLKVVVKKGAKGEVTAIVRGQIEVSFESAGIFWPAAKLKNVNPNSIKKL